MAKNKVATKAKDKLEDLGRLSLEDKEEDPGLQRFVSYYNTP